MVKVRGAASAALLFVPTFWHFAAVSANHREAEFLGTNRSTAAWLFVARVPAVVVPPLGPSAALGAQAPVDGNAAGAAV